MANISASQDKTLESLARILVANHIRLSVPPDLQGEAQSLLMSRRSRMGKASAVIVVVGAGASYDAVGMPLGNEAAKMLNKMLNVDDELFESELDRLSTQYSLDEGDFETKLLALSRFGESQLLDKLSGLFGRKFYCARSYEILAHLFKHRFVDAIINFNFDELLDQAIEDEVGRKNYWMITSDTDFDRERMWDLDERILLPLYVKPHGTASHRSSMRFTREAYFLLPVAIADLLLECLTKTGHVTIVTIGFGMRSVEFTKLVKKAWQARKAAIDVVAIDIDETVLTRFPSEIKGQRYILRPSRRGGIGSLLEQVWGKIKEIVTDRTLLRDIRRHRLLWLLFKDRPKLDAGIDKKDHLNYLRDRVVIELALEAAKAKGFVTIDQLEESRVWRYLRIYLNEMRGGHESIYTFARKLGFKKTGYSKDSMRLRVPEENEVPLTDLIITRDDWKETSKALCANVIATLSVHRQEIAAKANGELRKTLERMYLGKEVEVRSPRQSRNQLLFTTAREFRSLIGVQVFTKQLVEAEWDCLLCVAETGEWLLDNSVREVLRKKASGKVVVIVAFASCNDAIKQSYDKKNGINVSLLNMPWWLHNQHMTIAVQETNPVQAVYFEADKRARLFKARRSSSWGPPIGRIPDEGDAPTRFLARLSQWAADRDKLYAHLVVWADDRMVRRARCPVLRGNTSQRRARTKCREAQGPTLFESALLTHISSPS